MAKTKHQKLADIMRKMLSDIEMHGADVMKAVNFVQMHFYEPFAIVGRPPIKESAFKKMVCAHYANLRILSPDPAVRNICQELQCSGLYVNAPIRFQAYQSVDNKGMWVNLWRVKTIFPENNKVNLLQDLSRELLYCPRYDEITNEFDWFERESSENSLTYCFLSAAESSRRDSIIMGNLLKDPFPVWERAKEKWRTDPNEVCVVAKNPRDIDKINFAPRTGQSLSLAWEAVVESMRANTCRHRQSLRTIYKRELEREIFEGVPRTKYEKITFFRLWDDRLFKGDLKHQKIGRWEQCFGADIGKLSSILMHFITEFIKDPNKKKQFGEIACVLWVLIWSAQGDCEGRISIKNVLQITSKDIVPDDSAVKMNDSEVQISWGLRDLLICLLGKGEGQRACRLFGSLDVSGKLLERALMQASKKLFPDDTEPVLPAAFLVPAHSVPGVRIPLEHRKAMRKTKRLISPIYSRKDAKKVFLEALKQSS
jgi:hypothetical protein